MCYRKKIHIKSLSATYQFNMPFQFLVDQCFAIHYPDTYWARKSGNISCEIEIESKEPKEERDQWIHLEWGSNLVNWIIDIHMGKRC